MKTQKHKGFSLAEVLISLMLVSILVAVSAPILSKKNTVADSAWQWSTSDVKNGGVYKGDQVIVGPDKFIEFGNSVSDYNNNFFSKLNVLATLSPSTDFTVAALNTQLDSANGFPFTDADIINNRVPLDTMVISKPVLEIGGNHNALASSHIAFYTMGNTAGSIRYAGRLAGDESNLALGIGSLQSLNSNGTNQGVFNTAIGHYALDGNAQGIRNTAVGYNIFSSGNDNTAVGAGIIGVRNTGDRNTIAGNVTGQITGNDNTILGNVSTNITSNNNILIGNNAGSGFNISNSWANGQLSGSDALGNLLAIGNVRTDSSATDKEKVELIQARTQRVGDLPKKLVVNGDFIVKSKDGKTTLFKVDGSTVARNLYTKDMSQSNYLIKFYSHMFDKSESWINNVATKYNVINDCDNAKVCIAKFKRPVFNDGWGNLSIKDTEEHYDIYIEGMRAKLDGGCGGFSVTCAMNSAPYIVTLGTSLWYFDRFKESNSGLFYFFDGISNDLLDLFSYDGGTPAEKLKSANDTMHKNHCHQRYNVYQNKTPCGLLCGAIKGLYERSCGSDWTESDIRLKNVNGDNNDGLTQVNKLEVKDYTYKFDKFKKPHVGVIAQQLQKIFPTAVFKGEDGFLRIRLDEIFYAMVNSVKELSAKNVAIKDKIAAAQEKLHYIQEQNKLLKAENKLLQKQNKEFEKRIKKLQKEQKNK